MKHSRLLFRQIRFNLTDVVYGMRRNYKVSTLLALGVFCCVQLFFITDLCTLVIITVLWKFIKVKLRFIYPIQF